MKLNAQEKKFLLDLARRAAHAAIKGGGIDEREIDKDVPTDSLRECRGVFVAIYREGRLRGCMGAILEVIPLWQACRESACNAALKDVRFGPVQREEFSTITIEVTVIGQVRVLNDLKEVRPGTDGLILRKGFRQEAFLPRAVSDLIRDRHYLFDHLKSKVGIDSYDDSPEVWEVFEGDVFSDNGVDDVGTRG